MPTKRQARARRRAVIGTGLTTLAGLLAGAGTAVADAPVLSQGTSGPAVSQVQRALHIMVNGHFDSATEQAVLDFQRGDSLRVDGVVGPQTWGALIGAAPQSSTHTSSPTATGSAATSGSGASTSTRGYSSRGGYTIPSGIVSCESGGNYSAVNPSSGAGGAYQILPSTWQAYGGQGRPQDASPAEQGRIAAAIYANQGASAWSC
jgi:peptidoglycan hydrolase-like protein with peptidoglycan-binding domain